MSESRFWKYLHNKMPAFVMWRVENSAAPGMPDVFFITNGKSGWIELKEVKRESSILRINSAQIRWIRSYFWAGGKVFVLVKIVESKEVRLINGKVITGIRNLHVDSLSTLGKYPLPVDWAGLQQRIIDNL